MQNADLEYIIRPLIRDHERCHSVGSRQVEFVKEVEVLDLLKDHGITPERSGDDCVYLRMDGQTDIVRIHLTTSETRAVPADGARVVPTTIENLPAVVETITQKLHLSQVLLVPVGRWRNVFDAVAFSLAQNEDWQEIDTTATVELNTRDPLLCGPGDFHTVRALMRALLTDAENPEQGLMLTTTAAPVLVEVIPDGALRMSFGNQALADEVADAF